MGSVKTEVHQIGFNMHIFTRQAVSARNTSSHTFSKCSFIHSHVRKRVRHRLGETKKTKQGPCHQESQNGDSEGHINKWLLRALMKVYPQGNESKDKREIASAW